MEKNKNFKQKKEKEKIEEIEEKVSDDVEINVNQEKNIQDYKEKYIKSLAEMENLRKRMEEEKENILKYKISSFIQNILPTIDMFEIALNSKNVSEETKKWLIGFEMILKNLINAIENEGVKEIVVKKGDKFNSNIHHAIDKIEDKELEQDSIFEIKNKGYMIYNRLLRPASVVIVKEKIKEENIKEELKKENIKGDKNE